MQKKLNSYNKLARYKKKEKGRVGGGGRVELRLACVVPICFIYLRHTDLES